MYAGTGRFVECLMTFYFKNPESYYLQNLEPNSSILYNLKKSSFNLLTQPFSGYIIYDTTLRMQITVVGSSKYIKRLSFIFEKHRLMNPWAIKQKTFHRAQLGVLLNVWTLSTFTMGTTASQFLYSKKGKVREWLPLRLPNWRACKERTY